MDINFELLLTLATLLTGIIYLADVVYFAQRRQGKMPKVIEYSRSYFSVLLIVLLLRSFVVELFRIPTGSLEPTLIPGDFVAAEKYAYGIKLPVLHTKIISVGEPKNGDIAVLRWPVNPSIDFIKRVIGIPGDKISYLNKVLYINGVEQPQTHVGTTTDTNDDINSWPVEVRREIFNGIPHLIYVRPDIPAQDFTIVVPPDNYFVMGDNRDNSEDSRYWGFVPEANLVGKAFFLYFSWDSQADSLWHAVRWQRIGMRINENQRLS